MVEIDTRVQFLKGVGETRAKHLEKLGIFSIGALLRYYPRSFRDYSKTVPIVNANDGETVALKCKVITDITEQFIRKNMTVYKFVVTDDTGLLRVTVYNNKFIKSRIKKGETYIFYGKVTGFGTNKAISAPIGLLSITKR